MEPSKEAQAEDDRRQFLKKCGRFAVITPPAVTFLLSTSMSSSAIAASSGRAFPTGAAVGVMAAGAGATVVGAEALQQDGQIGSGQVVPVGPATPRSAPVGAPATPPTAPPLRPAAPAAPMSPGFGVGERG